MTRVRMTGAEDGERLRMTVVVATLAERGALAMAAGGRRGYHGCLTSSQVMLDEERPA